MAGLFNGVNFLCLWYLKKRPMPRKNNAQMHSHSLLALGDPVNSEFFPYGGFLAFHCTTMCQTFQMKKSVDKEKRDEISISLIEIFRIFLRFGQADDNLALAL